MRIPFLFLPLVACAVLALARDLSSDAPKLDGVPNFRDLGGYRTPDGRVVRRGQVYRSGHLNRLTDADHGKLAALHIRDVFDLRTPEECESAPTRWIGQAPAFHAFAAAFGPNDVAAMMELMADPAFTGAQARELMIQSMAEFPLSAAPNVAAWVGALAGGHTPSIIHCSAGKDRTGVFSALLLTLLGVDRETVLHDYLRSNDVLAANMAAASQALPAGMRMPRIAPDVLRALSRVEPEYLEATFQSIDAQCASFEDYRRNRLRIDDSELQRLRARLLAAD